MKTASARFLLGKLMGFVPDLVGFVFIIYGTAKLFSPYLTVAVFGIFGVSPSIAYWLTICLIAVDIYLGVSLVVLRDRRVAPIVAFCCLCIFSCYLVYLITLAEPPDCGCGGIVRLFESNKSNAVFGLFRNVSLLIGLLAWSWNNRNANVKEDCQQGLAQ